MAFWDSIIKNDTGAPVASKPTVSPVPEPQTSPAPTGGFWDSLKASPQPITGSPVPQTAPVATPIARGSVFDTRFETTPTTTSQSTPAVYTDKVYDYLFNPKAEIAYPKQPFTTPKEQAQYGTLKGPRIITGTAKIVSDLFTSIVEGIPNIAIRTEEAFKNLSGGRTPTPLTSILKSSRINPERIGLTTNDKKEIVPLGKLAIDSLNKLDQERPSTPNLNIIQSFGEHILPVVINAFVAGDVLKSATQTLLKATASSPSLGISSQSIKGMTPQQAFKEVGDRFTTRASQIIKANTKADGTLSGYGIRQLKTLSAETQRMGEAFRAEQIPELNSVGRFFDQLAIRLNQDIGQLSVPISAVNPVMRPASETIPGYKPMTPSPMPAGASVKPVQPVGFGDQGANIEKLKQNFAPGGNSYNTTNMYDKLIESGDTKAVDVYQDIPNKIYKPEIAKQVISDAKRSMEIEGFTDLGKKLENSLDVNNLTQSKLIKTANEIIAGTKAPETFTGFADLSTTILEKTKGRATVSKQFIQDLTNGAEVKQTEREIIRNVLNEYPSTALIPVKEFAEKVKNELLPLNIKDLKQIKPKILEQIKQEGFTIENNMDDSVTILDKNGEPVEYDNLPEKVKNLYDQWAGVAEEYSSVMGNKYENVALTPALRGDIKNYIEHIYESPIKTSAGGIHGFDTKKYFGHTRIEDMADDTTRRVIEVQSDLYQKGGVEREPVSKFSKLQESLTTDENILLTRALKNAEESTTDPYIRITKFFDKIPYKPTMEKIRAVGLSDKQIYDFVKNPTKDFTKELRSIQQYNDPTAHFRMIREEVKRASLDGKSNLLFPTGETAMKIEGLGETTHWYDTAEVKKIKEGGIPEGMGGIQALNRFAQLLPGNIKVGQQVTNENFGTVWIITDILGDGKFKAIPKHFEEQLKTGKTPTGHNFDIEGVKESFDISGKIDTNNPIYRFYEKDMARYLKNRFGAVPFTDDRGVTWWKVPIKSEYKTQPVLAFNRESNNIKRYGNNKISSTETNDGRGDTAGDNEARKGLSSGGKENAGILQFNTKNPILRGGLSTTNIRGNSQISSGGLESEDSKGEIPERVRIVQQVEALRNSSFNQDDFVRGKITKQEFADKTYETARSLNLPEKAAKKLQEYLSAMPDSILKYFTGVRYSKVEDVGIKAAFNLQGNQWAYEINPDYFHEPTFKTGAITKHEIGAHHVYAFSTLEERLKINSDIDNFMTSPESEEVLKKIFSIPGTDNYVPTVYAYFADPVHGEVKYIYNALTKIGIESRTAYDIIQKVGLTDKGDVAVLFSETSARPYFEKTKDIWSKIEKVIKTDYPSLWNESGWKDITFNRSYSQLRNEFLARYTEHGIKAPLLKDTTVQTISDLAESDAEALFKDTNFENANVKIPSVEVPKKRVPTEADKAKSPEEKLSDAKKALQLAETKLGVEPTDTTIIITSDKADRHAIEQSIKEINRITHRKAFEQSLQIKLPVPLEQKAFELALRKETLDANPMKNLVKFMARRGPFKGRLPEVTGGEGRGIFARHGDRYISEATGINDSEKARDAFETYIKTRKEFEKDIAQFSKDKQAFLKEARAKRTGILEDKAISRVTARTERHISELLGSEATRKAKIERLKLKEEETQKALKELEVLKAKYQRQVDVAKLNDGQRKSLLQKFKQYLSPISQTDKTTQQIYIDWETSKLKAKEQGNDVYDKFKFKSQNELPDIIDYEAGSQTPWIRNAFDDMFAEAKSHDLPVHYKDNYIPHVYFQKQEQIRDAIARYMKDNGVDKAVADEFKKTGEVPEKIAVRLKIRPTFTKIRTFPDYATAMKYGLTPRFRTVAEHLAYYKEEMLKTVANRDLIDNLIKEGKVLDGYDAPESWLEIKFPGRQFRQYYGPRELADSLNGQFRDEENLTGIQTILKYGAKASRIAQEIKLSAGIPGTNINFFSIGQTIKMLTTGIGDLAKLDLSGASSSLKASVAFLRANFNKPSLEFFKRNKEYIDLMAERRIPIARRVGDYEMNRKTWGTILTKQTLKEISRDAKNTAQDIKEIRSFADAKKALVNIIDSRIIGVPKDVFDKLFNEKTFTSFMPQMQVQIFKDIYIKAIKEGVGEKEAADFASEIIKNEFGLINDLGRTKTVQDAMGAILFAPKFREGIINVFANAAKGASTEFKNAAFSRNRSFLLGMILTYIAYNFINRQLNNGDDMWDNQAGREFALKIPLPNGKIVYIEFMPSVLSFVRNLGSAGIAMAKGDADTALQKAGTLFSMPIKFATEIISNKDYFGRPIYEITDSAYEKAKKVVEHLGLGVAHPYFSETVRYFEGKQDIWQTLSMASELPLKFSTAEKEAMSRFYEQKQAKSELKAHHRAEIVDMVTIYDQVQKLKQEGKSSEARAIIDDMSDEDYAQYQIIMKYEEIAALKKNKQYDDAKALGDTLTTEQYDQYQAIKTIRTGQKRSETLTKKVSKAVKPTFTAGQKLDDRSLFETIKVYATAIGTDPATAFQRVFSGQRIRRVDNDTIIVERIPLLESQKIKRERKATADLILDHTIPLQLGGDNSDENLKLVPRSVWQSYTPAENHLGKLLRSNKITKKEAQDLINRLKSGNIPVSDIMKL